MTGRHRLRRPPPPVRRLLPQLPLLLQPRRLRLARCGSAGWSSTSCSVIDHFHKPVDHTIFRWDSKEYLLVLDIGANDGTLLRRFEERGMRVLGIDPGKRTGALCRANGISVCETFWDLESAKGVKHLNLKPDLITATGCVFIFPRCMTSSPGCGKSWVPKQSFSPNAYT